VLLAKLDVTEPLDYPSLMRLVSHCVFVITDSGGLQKEAYFSGKRALVVMPDTGWRELVDIGWNVLLCDDAFYWDLSRIEVNDADVQDSKRSAIYGDAAEKIVKLLTR